MSKSNNLKILTIIGTRPQFIKSARGVFEGKVKGVEIPAERALDIDSELDFVIAEFLIHRMEKSKKKLYN